MERRRFSRVLLGWPLLGVARVARASNAAPPLVLQVSPLAGFQFHEAPRVWDRLSVGDALTLVREPDNPFDARAVRVEWRGHKLGHLPRVENAAASQLLDRGARLCARIAWLRDHPDPWKRVGVEVGAETENGIDVGGRGR